MDAFLFHQNEFLIIAIVLALLLIANEIGYLEGRAGALEYRSAARTQHTTLQGATMGLLGLLLAFTFSMSASRFETRKQLVVDETNAVNTVYLRARLLPESSQGEVVKLLRSYLDARLACYVSNLNQSQLLAATAKVRNAQSRLWSQAVNAAAADSRSIPAGLFVRALNDAFDVAGRRDAARDNHVPGTVMFLLFVMAALTMALLGFGCGLGAQRHLMTTTAVALLISLVILIILDLDRPRRGFITISQRSLIELRDSIR